MNNIDKKSRLPHKVLIRDRSNIEIERMCSWCHEQFGIRFSIVDRSDFGYSGVWQCVYDGFLRDSTPAYKFSFDNEKHANWFALRWL